MFLTFYQAEVTWNSTSKGFDRFVSGYTEKLGQKSSLVAFWGLTAHMGGPSLAHVMLKIFWGGKARHAEMEQSEHGKVVYIEEGSYAASVGLDMFRVGPDQP